MHLPFYSLSSDHLWYRWRTAGTMEIHSSPTQYFTSSCTSVLDVQCNNPVRELTGLWFLPKLAFGLNTNDDEYSSNTISCYSITLHPLYSRNFGILWVVFKTNRWRCHQNFLRYLINTKVPPTIAVYCLLLPPPRAPVSSLERKASWSRIAIP